MEREFVRFKMKLVDRRVAEGTLKVSESSEPGNFQSLGFSKLGNVTASRAGGSGQVLSARSRVGGRGQEAGLTWAGCPGSAWWVRCCAADTRRAPRQHLRAD